MRRYIKFLIVILTFSFSPLVFSQDKDLSELKSFRQDIQIINLLNNLDLRKEQTEFIIKKAELVKDIQEGSYRQIYYRSPEMVRAYEAIKEEVGEGRVLLERESTKKFRQLQDEIIKIKREGHDKINEIALSVEKKLEPFQINALDNYRFCIIPIVSENRIGQSSSALGIVKLLERVKDIPARRYNERKTHIADYFLERAKGRIPLGIQIDESQVKSKALNTFETARSLNEVDFQVRKEVTGG